MILTDAVLFVFLLLLFPSTRVPSETKTLPTSNFILKKNVVPPRSTEMTIFKFLSFANDLRPTRMRTRFIDPFTARVNDGVLQGGSNF